MQLQLCGWLFKTNLVQYYMGVRLDDNYLRLGRNPSEHPASRRTIQGNAAKTGVDALDNLGSRYPPLLGVESAVGGNES